jgi:hypothetical protein
MSVRIGEVPSSRIAHAPHVHVWASTGGVEIHSDKSFTLDGTQARNFAALLERAADEVARLRSSSLCDVCSPTEPKR